jgi:carbonic anhydrase
MFAIEKTLRYPFRYLKYDFIAGIVVFLVAIPLCLGIALASGAPLISGIIAGIIGGVVVGIISQSPVSVSGPAAGMVAVVLAAITQLGGFNAFLLALFFAGILQVTIGLLRTGFIADYVPSNVIQGLLCAIGILIIIKQLPFAFTYTAQNDLLMSSFNEAAQMLNFAALEHIGDHFNVGALIISVISLVLLIFFDKTQLSRLKNIPGPVVVVVVGALLNESYSLFMPSFTQYSSDLVNIPNQSGFASFLAQLQFPDWSAWKNVNVYIYAVVLAAVASLEALLNLEAIEKLDTKRRYCPRDRELVAQGVGNALSGLIGGLPITSVIVRGSVNIQAGAKTKISTIVHGFLLLFAVVLIPSLINLIPLASLATILIYVGFKLTKPAIYTQMLAQGASRFIPFIVTIIAILMTNLLTGILIGLFTGFFFILRDNSKIQLDIINEKHPLGDVKRIALPQHMSFLRKASLVRELDNIPVDTHLIIDARYAKYIDKDILEVIDVFTKTQAPNKKIAVNLIGFKDYYEIHDKIDFVNVTTYDMQSSLTPDQVLDILKEGNHRFLTDQPIHRSLLDDVKATSGNQHPIAIVLGCIDSRVPVETIFDMGVGDVFVARIAGNVINDDIIASMEFACHISGAKLIVVLGHTFCGAIRAACDHSKGGHLTELLDKIQPAIESENTISSNRDSHNPEFVLKVTKLNIENSIAQIKRRSNILNQMINDGAVKIVGALYDVQSGTCHF